MKVIKQGLKLLTLGLFCLSQAIFAQTIMVPPNTEIVVDKSYHNVTLNLMNGNFIIKNHATLNIENCTIIGKISETKPIIFDAVSGNLQFINNKASFVSENILPHPDTLSTAYIIRVNDGTVNIERNHFTIENPYTAGFLLANSNFVKNNFHIIQNQFFYFHGVLYLLNASNELIANNVFNQNSYGNIVTSGDHITVTQNKIYFPGKDDLGNGVDIVDSTHVIVSKNMLATPSSYGVNVVDSQAITIDSNRIYNAKSYAINITSLSAARADKLLVSQLIGGTDKKKNLINGNIAIADNFLSQNRYGLAARNVAQLAVTNNYFSQRFTDAASRKFWTDNTNLLKNITELTWIGNVYKEAYAQVMPGDNSHSLDFVVFPKTGGISL